MTENEVAVRQQAIPIVYQGTRIEMGFRADKRLGLLINFNVVLIKDGITRIANGMPE